MKTKPTILRGQHMVYWYEYPAGQGPYGSGGWSRHAQHRPKPVLVIRPVTNLELSGKSVIVDGVRKLKCTIIRQRDGVVVRADYPVDRIKQELLTNTIGRVELEPMDDLHPLNPAPFGRFQRALLP